MRQPAYVVDPNQFLRNLKKQKISKTDIYGFHGPFNSVNWILNPRY